MGLPIKDLVPRTEIGISDLKGKILAVDTMNLLYQFLTTIRGPDGEPLTNIQGQVTSHLIGLFNRTTSLMESGIRLVFIFDGKAPDIKQATWEKRAQAKDLADLKLQEAKAQGDLELMRKYSSRSSKLTREMIKDAQNLIISLGCPIINAPSEGEAQAAHLVKKGQAYACVSQDYDTLIFGSPLIIRNLSIDARRRRPGAAGYETLKPELIELSAVLAALKIDIEQLRVLSILVGTDYNPGGIRGIGPKKALKLIHKYEHNYPALFDHVNWAETYPHLPWSELLSVIVNIPITDDYTLKWSAINQPELLELMVGTYGFDKGRVAGKLFRLAEVMESTTQRGLTQFFN